MFTNNNKNQSQWRILQINHSRQGFMGSGGLWTINPCLLWFIYIYIYIYIYTYTCIHSCYVSKVFGYYNYATVLTMNIYGVCGGVHINLLLNE